jgi:hypothetical protein
MKQVISSFTLVSCLHHSPTLKTEATHSSQESVDSEWATQRCVPEDVGHAPLEGPEILHTLKSVMPTH